MLERELNAMERACKLAMIVLAAGFIIVLCAATADLLDEHRRARQAVPVQWEEEAPLVTEHWA